MVRKSNTQGVSRTSETRDYGDTYGAYEDEYEVEESKTAPSDARPSLKSSNAPSGKSNNTGPNSAGSGQNPPGGAGETEDPDLDPELEAMKQRLNEMEQEAARFREMQASLEKEMDLSTTSSHGHTAPEETKEDVDARSIFVGNVDYGATPEEIQTHFGSVGTINRVTILCDKWTMHPKGYAYVEFADPSSVQSSMVMNETIFRGRPLKVTPKRTNIPGMNRFGGRGGAPRGRGGPYRGGYPGPRGYGGPYRGRPHYRGRRGAPPNPAFYAPF